MLKYRLSRENDNERIYFYYPEGKEDYGIIAINKKTGEIRINSLAKEDRGIQIFYAYKLVRQLEKFYRTGEYRESGIVAWY